MTCSCARIKVGMTVTKNWNWNPDCVEHGIKSEWWNSDEQQQKRELDNLRLRDLQRKAREARAQARKERGRN